MSDLAQKCLRSMSLETRKIWHERFKATIPAFRDNEGKIWINEDALLNELTVSNLRQHLMDIFLLASHAPDAAAVLRRVVRALDGRRSSKDTFDAIDANILMFWDDLGWFFAEEDDDPREPEYHAFRCGLRSWAPIAAAAFLECKTDCHVTEEMFTQRRKRLGLRGGKRKLVKTAVVIRSCEGGLKVTRLKIGTE